MINQHQTDIILGSILKFKPKLIGVFGSYARNEQTSESDLDLLVDFEDKLGLLELIGLEQELSEQLGIKVDLITLHSLNLKIKPLIMKDLVKIA